MRLLHPVLLPIVIVFASNTKLLHARTLNDDETDVSVRRFLRSNTAEAGRVDGQSTSGVARFIDRVFRKSASAPKATTVTTEAQVTAGEAAQKARENAEKSLEDRLRALLSEKGGALVNSKGSSVFAEMVKAVDHVNKKLPRDHAISLDEFLIGTVEHKRLVELATTGAESTKKEVSNKASKLLEKVAAENGIHLVP